MLIHTSSGSTSVGHLAQAAPGFAALHHRPDVSFACGGLIFPVRAAPSALGTAAAVHLQR